MYKWLGNCPVTVYNINMPVFKSVNKDFFKKWSRDMAYVLGFFAADGNIINTKQGGYYVSFYSSDKNILLEMQRAMNSNHKLSKRNNENTYRFQIGSKEMFHDLSKLGFIQKKTRRIKIPKISQKFSLDFIRGYFDGDGNVWSGEINRQRSKPTKVLQVTFTSGCGEFLNGLHVLLKKNGIEGGSFFKIKNKNCWRLLFSTLDSLKIYKIMYNTEHKLYLKRKKLMFENFINMRP